MELRDKIIELRRSWLSIEYNYISGEEGIDGDEDFSDALIKEIIIPLAKEAFEASLEVDKRNRVAFKYLNADDYIKEKFKVD